VQIKQIVESIRQFGWTNPILIDENNMIIAGHGRYYAALAMEMKQVPTITLRGLSDAQKRAYVIADNNLALNAGWNPEILALELDQLRDEAFDLSLLGFDLKELNELIGTPNTVPGEFPAVDENIETEHECPKCGFKYSGGGSAA
jgi:ParB-like chromosome segregation protein Spo0J